LQLSQLLAMIPIMAKRRRRMGGIGRSWGAASLALMLLAALAACGKPGDPAYDKAFNAAFDKSTHDSCVPSAVAHGASPEAAESYCTCVVKELDNLPVARKQALNGSSPELSNAAADCRP
jgi:hypothetical protein